ncbi:intraflagellar transport protein 74 homolog [Thalassophryne amazonica]|uniref:intraflagellar transport protein 74 homolog n=1 Tax=Thalassophryne amazonica TaxID=390379 RepID=UPI0014715145|nr:intraflagellar transport protein 74 homolog [Thalassophryne amazonica]
MASQRPPSGLGRPVSRSGSVVPGTARSPMTGRPPTAIRVATGMVPGTSAMRGGVPISTPGILSAQFKVTDRPMTQQGLSGMKTSMKGPQRQILDKSYYLGLLRSKMSELTTETSKLHKEVENYNQENSVYLSFEKRAEGLAKELKDLQGQLADYNMLVDKFNTNTEMEEMIDDFNILKVHNDSMAESMYSIFTQRTEKEEAIKAVEEEIRRERQVADEVVKAMSPAKQEKYFSMTATNKELLQNLSVLQKELDILLTRKEDYEAELSHSQIKQEMVRYHDKLSLLEEKRDTMEAEYKNVGSPQEERERLFKQVKEDNQEISSMERQLVETRDRTSRITEEIRQLEQDLEDTNGESHQKYKELKKKLEEIDRFLESFEEVKAQEEENMTQTQGNIVSLLEHCSRNMLRLRHVGTVTATELKDIQQVLSNKELDVVQSENTTRGLTTEYQRLQHDLEKMQQLEGKISTDLSALQEHVSTMETELITYRDLDTLKYTAEEKKKKLQQQHVSLMQRRDALRQLLQEMNQKYETLKTKLQENVTHTELTNLERRWQHLEQNNFVMKEFIASKSQESDYSSVAKNVMQQVSEYNKSLIESLKTS